MKKLLLVSMIEIVILVLKFDTELIRVVLSKKTSIFKTRILKSVAENLKLIHHFQT